MKRKSWVNALICFWVVASAAAYFWVKSHYLSLPENHFAHFSTSQAHDIATGSPLLTSRVRAIVVHFVDSSCPCSRFSETHIQSLEARFDESTHFFRWPDVPNDILDTEIIQAVPVSPAIAIWSSEGKLAYLGPYSSGVFCGEGDDFASLTITQLLAGNKIELMKHDALGCFCPWRHEEEIQNLKNSYNLN